MMAQALKIARFRVTTEYGDTWYVAFGKARKTQLPVYYASPYGLVECQQIYPDCLQLVTPKEHFRPRPTSRKEIKRRYGKIITEESYREQVAADGGTP